MQLREPRRDPRGTRAATSAITMPTTPTFDAISLTDLSAVTGGCGKKKCASCPPPQQPAPMGPPPSGGGTEITTNVQLTGFGSAAQ
jgi:hypothetical protein